MDMNKRQTNPPVFELTEQMAISKSLVKSRQATKDRASLRILGGIVGASMAMLLIYTFSKLDKMQSDLDKLLFNTRAANSSMQIEFDKCEYRKGQYACEYSNRLPGKIYNAKGEK